VDTSSLLGREIKALSLRANFSWTFVGNVIYAGTQWGLTILMTKQFSPEVFGRFALALSIVTPIFTAGALQLRAVMVSDETDTIPFSSYLSLRILTSFFSIILVLIIGIFGNFSSQFFYLMLFLGLGQGIIMIKDIYQGVMQRNERMDFASFSRVLQGIISLLVAVILSLYTKNVVFVTVGMFIGRFFTLIAYDLPIIRSISRHRVIESRKRNKGINFKELWSLTRIAFPMGIVTLLISLHVNIPRYFLALSFGEEAVGFFAAVATYLALEEIVISALGQSAAHRLASCYVSARKEYFRLLGKLTFIGIIIGGLGVILSLFWGKEIITIFFRKEYAVYTNVLIWLMIARVFLNIYNFAGYSLTAARKFSVQVWISGLMTGSLFLASWLFIPKHAGLGAAWAILLSAVIGLFASVFAMREDLFGKKGY
jgi:O-antigen/teichoic acid export membrane protein